MSQLSERMAARGQTLEQRWTDLMDRAEELRNKASDLQGDATILEARAERVAVLWRETHGCDCGLLGLECQGHGTSDAVMARGAEMVEQAIGAGDGTEAYAIARRLAHDARHPR